MKIGTKKQLQEGSQKQFIEKRVGKSEGLLGVVFKKNPVSDDAYKQINWIVKPLLGDKIVILCPKTSNALKSYVLKDNNQITRISIPLLRRFSPTDLYATFAANGPTLKETQIL